MTENNNKLILWGVVILGGIILINKAGNIFGINPAPTLTTGLNPAFFENDLNKRKYKYSYSSSKYDELQNDIYDSLGFVKDDYPGVIAALHQAITQGDIFGIAKYFKLQHNMDLWEFLKSGNGYTPFDGLNNGHLIEINEYVNSLPL